MKFTGKIIVLAYPDTFVSVSDEWQCRFFPLVGLGTREYIKAGHAALILIENESKIARYFDFGRYITPRGYGRVRGADTDAELEIPFDAVFGNDSSLLNVEEFLLWLDANPHKTHGQGRLLASVCETINFKQAESFILKLHKKGSVRYGAFNKAESNCSRFVTDTILASTTKKEIQKALKFNKLFTPSTVGNVEKAATSTDVFEVLNGEITSFTSSAFRENLKNYFHKIKPIVEEINLPTLPDTAQKLAGTGSSAWFDIVPEKLPKDLFRIKRYNELHELDFDGIYGASESFCPSESFRFTYDSHCAFCTIIQKDKRIKLTLKAAYEDFNSLQKVHSA